MLKKLTRIILIYLFRGLFWLRYKVEIKGFETLNKETLNRGGGVLFVPNHPTVFVDPILMGVTVWKKFPIRPMIIEYMYHRPFINGLMRFLQAVPIPSFRETSNSLKKRRGEEMLEEIFRGVKAGDNFLIFPAGRIKLTAYEAIGGSSSVHRILENAPEVNVVLVRFKGLWGSIFSWAPEGGIPDVVPGLIHGFKTLLKNFIFFTPRRCVTVEFEVAPKDFPYKGTRKEINKYLEQWYNRPDGLTEQKGEYPGDSLVMVPYAFWSKKVLKPRVLPSRDEEVDFKCQGIPKEVCNKVIAKISALCKLEPKKIHYEMNLGSDLGMDSLDVAELIAFLQFHYNIEGLAVSELTTVGKVLAVAAGEVIVRGAEEEEGVINVTWKAPKKRERVFIAEGKTIPEVFLNNCKQMGNTQAVGDETSGMLTYAQMKMRMILLAEYIQTLPGDYVGIMLPSTVAVEVVIMATLLAGKVPLMINWTIGRRHLESVLDVSKVEVILTAWSFIDKLDNVDLGPIEDRLVMLEDLRPQFTIWQKLRALFRSKRSPEKVLQLFHYNKKEEDQAVLLFTSGTESTPKGVPLTHRNILSNQRAALELLPLYNDDVLLAVLPPFHSFGFTLSGMIGLLSGMHTAYFPNPTDGKRMARAMHKWKATIMCGAPTFVKGMLRGAKEGQLESMRLCVTGAEKAPPELIQGLEKIGKGDILVEGYGITECSPILTVNLDTKTFHGVGHPLSNVELCIVHQDTHEPLAVGIPGLILARGPNIFAGYVNKGLSSPFLTINGVEWYITGDMGFLDEKGRLTLSGRLKRFVKLGAEMVSLASIEDALKQLAIDVGSSTDEGGPSLAVCAKEVPGEKTKVTLFTTLDLNVEKVNKELRSLGFSNLIKVAHVVRLDEIPVMGTGKINYRQLEKNHL